MKNYLVTFFNNGHKICSCVKTAESAENAEMDASFALMCKYRNVEFNNVKTEELYSE